MTGGHPGSIVGPGAIPAVVTADGTYRSQLIEHQPFLLEIECTPEITCEASKLLTDGKVVPIPTLSASPGGFSGRYPNPAGEGLSGLA